MHVVYVRHYLDNRGMLFFQGEWFPKVQLWMSRLDFGRGLPRPGYISVSAHSAPEHPKDGVNLIVKFTDLTHLNNWVLSEEHQQLVHALDPFRTQPWNWYACTQPPEGTDLNFNSIEWETVY